MDDLEAILQFYDERNGSDRGRNGSFVVKEAVCWWVRLLPPEFFKTAYTSYTSITNPLYIGIPVV